MTREYNVDILNHFRPTYTTSSSSAKGGAYYEYRHGGNVYTTPTFEVDAGTQVVTSLVTQMIVGPENVTARAGTTATFSVTASGNNVSYQWYYCNTDVLMFKKCDFEGAQTNTLYVPVTEEMDGWMFMCDIGSESRSATLTVIPAETPAVVGTRIDATSFPDANFRAFVLSELDANGDGALSAAEIASVTVINCGGKSITDLSGLEYFPELEILRCFNNKLTGLDLSGNPALKQLSCGNNQLKTLNLSENALLEYLSCSDNNLTVLDISNCPALVKLCRENPPVTGNDGITRYGYYLYCDGAVAVRMLSLAQASPDLVLPAALTEIGEEAFAGGPYVYVRLPEQSVVIGPRAFADCLDLAWVYIPSGASIDPSAFEGTRALTILGRTGSSAETYAKTYGFTFQAAG